MLTEVGKDAGEEGWVAPVSLARAGLFDGGTGGEIVGTRNGSGGWGDILAHNGFLEAFAVLLGAAIGTAALLSDPYRVRAAAIGAGSATFLRVAWFLLGLLLLARFKLGDASIERGGLLLGSARGALLGLFFDGG